MNSAVVIDVIRTPLGKRNRGLSGWHAVDLSAYVLQALFERNAVDPAEVDEVLVGCVSQVGEQAGNVARFAWLAAGLPESVSGTSIDLQCASSLQAMNYAAQSVMTGTHDIVVAAGVELMSRIPIGAFVGNDSGHPYDSVGLRDRYWADDGPGLIDRALSAELIADKWNLTREELDDYGYESQVRAVRAQKEGRFDREIVPVVRETEDGSEEVRLDEGPRADIDRDRLAELKPIWTDGGKITVATSSQVADGATAMLVMSEERAQQLGLVPRARLASFAVAGSDPIEMAMGTIPATKKAISKAGIDLSDVDRVEINEPFVPPLLAWTQEMDYGIEQVNVNGGACALGHPLGATGVRLAGTLLCELERTGGRWGLEAIPGGAGIAAAMVMERLG